MAADVRTEKLKFEQYYEKYYNQVYLYINKKIQNVHDAEDLATDVFIACYEKFDSFDPGKASFQTWVFFITNNKLKNYYRDRKINIDIDDPEQYIEPAEEGFEDDFVAAEYLTAMREYLAEALQEVSELQRTIITESYFHNKSSKEIALKLHMTDGNVRVQLSRALAKMRVYFEKNNISWEMD
ncbi:MAG: sigma-70 family RNA polymerase sigma factor [Clostridia bacterium]|nr:sigma-70 family RNA polymerase sigma factor [Clostridia bacterium]